MTRVQDQTILAANFALSQRHSAQQLRAIIALSGSAVAMVLSIMLMLALAKRIAGAIRRLLHITERIGAGQYDNAIDESGVDEISRLYAGVSHMQRQLKTQIESERAQSIANGRIRAALDNVSGTSWLPTPAARSFTSTARARRCCRMAKPISARHYRISRPRACGGPASISSMRMLPHAHQLAADR